MQYRTRILVAVFLAWFIVVGLFVSKLGGGGQDDMFISYRYARSAAQGDGLVFNMGERHFGATEPGMALLLAGTHRLSGIPIPWLGTLATGIGLLVIGVAMTADGIPGQRLVAALLGGTLLVSSTPIWICHGAAAPMVVAFLVTAGLIARRRQVIAGLLAGAAVWLRPDAVIGMIAVGLVLWWRQRRFPLRFGVTAAFIVAGGLVWSWSYYGSILPSTLAAKQFAAQWQPGTWPSGLMFWQAFLPGWRAHLGLFAPVILIGGFLGWVFMWKRGGLAARVLIANGAILALAYPFLGVGFYPWYVIPTIAAWLYGFSYLVSECCQRFAVPSTSENAYRNRRNGMEALMAAALVAAVASRTIPMVAAYRGSSHLDAYRKAAIWVRDNTPQGARVAFFEVGVVGWYSERPIFDLLGLVTPGVAEKLGRRRAFEEALRAQPTEIVLDHTARRVGNLPSREWFKEMYDRVAVFPDTGGGQVVIYRRRSPEEAG